MGNAIKGNLGRILSGVLLFLSWFAVWYWVAGMTATEADRPGLALFLAIMCTGVTLVEYAEFEDDTA